ncbi:hypothetical protein GYMLUDRAFT_405665 [Collybiopsis luxurians FD-317 M1]|uniref:Uncharacterized protein n=1 Tax=Collybiopsis luxurians FD-317 M1 TaxID=944289 RepID=A0A0D0BA45_9AGAR|nr:hypothetical protein GYMLUDRAFT_405665 [Collybiopsis luxurians FD-317 M1]
MSSDTSFPLTEATLVAAFFGTALYSVHTVAFAFAFRYLIWDTKGVRKTSIHWFFVVSGLLLWILPTLHVILLNYDIVHAFVFENGPAGPGAALVVRQWRGSFRVGAF